METVQGITEAHSSRAQSSHDQISNSITEYQSQAMPEELGMRETFRTLKKLWTSSRVFKVMFISLMILLGALSVLSIVLSASGRVEEVDDELVEGKDDKFPSEHGGDIITGVDDFPNENDGPTFEPEAIKEFCVDFLEEVKSGKYPGVSMGRVLMNIPLNEERKVRKFETLSVAFQKQLEEKDKIISGLKTAAESQRLQITKLSAEIKSLEEEVSQQRHACQQELAQTEEHLNEFRREREQLAKQVEILPILAIDQAKLQLLSQTAQKTVRSSLLYQGSRDGYHKITLLSHVANKESTVTIVKTTTGRVFGAFLSIPWEVSGGARADAQAFTFSASKGIVCKVVAKSNAVHFTDDNVIEFGNGEFMIDMSAGEHPTGMATSGHGYECGAEDPNDFYSDGTQFAVSELYIYQLEVISTESASKGL